FREMATLANSD
ncbi:hypothetical protein D030_3114B, partial [Vibrio parahaemolyticus AQ3810]